MKELGLTRTVTLGAGLALSLLALHPARAEASSIRFETVVNESFDGTGNCFLGSGPSCSGFIAKQYVWLDGGDPGSFILDGLYFFSVLTPGSTDANDGASGNLSDDFDPYTNRTFAAINNEIFSYSGTHIQDVDETNNNDRLLRIFPFATTPDLSGTYTLAVCSLRDGYPALATGCFYNSFTVNADGSSVPAVPEPTSLVLLSTGLAILVRRTTGAPGR